MPRGGFFFRCVLFSFLLLLFASTPALGVRWVNRTATYFGLSPVPLRITAIADLDNTMRTGFLGTWADRTRVVWYCRGKDGGGAGRRGRGSYALCWESSNFPSRIVSTIVTDLNRDGVLDIVVQCEDGGLYFVNGRHRNDAPKVILKKDGPRFNASIPQMSLVSVFGHCGLPEIAFVDMEGSLILMRSTTEVFSGTQCRGKDTHPTFEPVPLVKGVKNVTRVVPLSIISEDIDGDCAADLLYTVHQEETNTLMVYAFFPQSKQEELLLTLEPAHRYGFPVAADVNGDGAPDILFPICDTGTARVSYGECTRFGGFAVFYNQLRGAPPCTRDGCCNGHPYGFAENASQEFFFHNGSLCGIYTTADVPLAMTSSLASPLIMRSGDYNRDGYTDLLVPSTYGPLLLTLQRNDNNSVAFRCEPVDPILVNTVQDRRLAYTQAVPFFATVTGNGRLDILLTYHDDTPLPVTLYMGYQQGVRMNYFFTSSALNGAAGVHDWGVHQPGAVHRFGWSDIAMRQRWAYAAQLSRSQGHALQHPRLFFGLGQTFSYIQDYAVGILVDGRSVYRRWGTALVPNSNMFVWPNPLLSPNDWRQLLYIFFFRHQKLLFGVLVATLAVIAVPVIGLKWREVRHDRHELEMR